MKNNPTPISDGCGENFPVTMTLISEAMTYANRLSAQHGFRPSYRYNRKQQAWAWDKSATGYRLPTQSEWLAFTYGDLSQQPPNSVCDHANILDMSIRNRGSADVVLQRSTGERISIYASCSDGWPELAPVGSFRSPADLVWDSLGNAPEWIWAEDEAGRLSPTIIGGAYWWGADWSDLKRIIVHSERIRSGGLRLVRAAPSE